MLFRSRDAAREIASARSLGRDIDTEGYMDIASTNGVDVGVVAAMNGVANINGVKTEAKKIAFAKIGRASCRERV